MKVSVLFLMMLACGSAAHIHSATSNNLPKTLNDDFMELILLLPRLDILNILISHLNDDTAVQELAEFLYSDAFEASILTIDAEPSFIAVLDFLEAEGVEIYDLLNELHKLFKIPEIVRPMSMSMTSPRGWRDMWNEIMAVMPGNELYDFHCGKMAAGQEWRVLFDHLSGEEFRGLVNVFGATDSWQTLLSQLAEYDVHLEVVVTALQRLLNWDGDSVDFCVSYVPPK